MFRYLCVLLCLIVVMVICFDGSVAETEDVDLAQQVEDLKERVKALSDANERLNLQIEDLYCMSQTSRIRILDEEEGSFYYAHIGENWFRMLPSEVPKAKLYYELRSADNLGYSKEKQKALGDKFLEMIKKTHFKIYGAAGYIYQKDDLRYHPDWKSYVIFDNFYK